MSQTNEIISYKGNCFETSHLKTCIAFGADLDFKETTISYLIE